MTVDEWRDAYIKASDDVIAFSFAVVSVRSMSELTPGCKSTLHAKALELLTEMFDAAMKRVDDLKTLRPI